MHTRKLGVVAVLAAAVLGGAECGRGADRAAGAARVNWLDKAAPGMDVGVSFGVPWAQGTVQKGQAFAMKAADGAALPLQNWPLAYWPDGSIKWMGFATVAGPEAVGPVEISAGTGVTDYKGAVVAVTDGADAVTVNTGKITARLPKSGKYLIDSLSVDGKEVATHGELECIDQTGPTEDHLNPPARVDYFSLVQKVTVEQSGPVRAVVKIEGMHAQSGPLAGEQRKWLPFVVRLYFYAGDEPIRMVHTIIFDGDQDKDFIRGLGVEFDVPMREQTQNRHVRFGNSNGGVWAEPLQQVLARGRGTGIRGAADQMQGDRLPNLPDGTTP